MNAWKVVLATLVIFVAGIVTGATLVRFAQGGRGTWRNPGRPVQNIGPSNPGNPGNPNRPDGPRSPNSNPAPGLLSREFIQVLERQLQLTPEQREQIGRIMAEGQERVRTLRDRIDPELRKEMQQTREQIRAVLTPDQREQFEQMMKRVPRRNERGDGPGPVDGERRIREPRNPPTPDGPRGEMRDLQPPPQPRDP